MTSIILPKPILNCTLCNIKLIQNDALGTSYFIANMKIKIFMTIVIFIRIFIMK